MALMRSSRPTMSTANAWARRDVHRIDHAQERGQQEDVPHLHVPGECQTGQDERQKHGRGLGRDQDAVAIVAVGDRSADGGQQEDRNLAGKPHKAQQDRRAGEAVDQPRLRHGLHPRADQRNELAAEEQPVVLMPKGPDHMGQSRRPRGRLVTECLPALRFIAIEIPHARCLTHGRAGAGFEDHRSSP